MAIVVYVEVESNCSSGSRYRVAEAGLTCYIAVALAANRWALGLMVLNVAARRLFCFRACAVDGRANDSRPVHMIDPLANGLYDSPSIVCGNYSTCGVFWRYWHESDRHTTYMNRQQISYSSRRWRNSFGDNVYPRMWNGLPSYLRHDIHPRTI